MQRNGANLPTEPHGQLILQLLRPLGLKVGGVLPLEELFRYADQNGIAADALEAALIDASAQGWVMAWDNKLAISKSGYQLLYPANNNAE